MDQSSDVLENILTIRKFGEIGFLMVVNPAARSGSVPQFEEADNLTQDLMIYYEFTTLGKTIRRLRTNRGLSQEAFAESCGLHRTYICDVERGVRNVTLGTLLKIARASGISVSELTRNVENDVRPPEKSQTQPFNYI
jgi:DNA-binding XRE family transcriptional regulator